MFIKYFLPVFLLLGSVSLSLGQTSVGAVSVIRPGGVFTITSLQPLCSIATPVAIGGVNRALAEPLPTVLGGCRVRFTQVASGEQIAALQTAHTMGLSIPGFRPGWTLVVGVVPARLSVGSVSIIVEKVEPRAVSSTETEWVVVGAVTLTAEVGQPADRPAQIGLVGDNTEIKVE